jgi:hypothetical protein
MTVLVTAAAPVRLVAITQPNGVALRIGVSDAARGAT